MTVQAPWEVVLLDWAHQAFDSGITSHGGQHATNAEFLEAAYLLCESITRENSKTFYIASGLLPPDRRRAARALYAFCRVTDNIIDHAQDESAEVTRAKLEAWRALALDSHPPTNEMVALAWADARHRFQIPGGYAQQLIDGVAGDLTKKRYQTFDELAEYSYGVASTVGLMAMHIIGFTGENAIPYAVKLGVALQVTNILRDIQEDWEAGRLYLPAEELARFGLSEADIAAGVVDDRWRAFMNFQITRTRDLYREAYSGIALLDATGRFAIAACADLYRAILKDIEKHDHDVFSRRAHVSALGKLSMLPGIYTRSRRVKLG